MKTLFTTGLALAFAVPAAAQMATPSPTQYVKKAGAGDLYEKTSSQLVLRTTRDPKVRSFATMMISDHAKSTADVKMAATRAGLKPMPPMLDAAKTRMIANLRAASGTARDRLYWQQQATAHQEALALHQGYAADGTSTPLKAAAAKIAPVVQHHIDMLQSNGAMAM